MEREYLQLSPGTYYMHPAALLATSHSRLHLDLIVTRLKRAGISRGLISAIFPAHLKPNSALCWLDGCSKPAELFSQEIVVAGPLGKKISFKSPRDAADSLGAIGFSPKAAHACLAGLERGELVVCVETSDPAEIAISWHTLRELEAEHISLAFAREEAADAAASSPEEEVDFAPAFSPA